MLIVFVSEFVVEKITFFELFYLILEEIYDKAYGIDQYSITNRHALSVLWTISPLYPILKIILLDFLKFYNDVR